MDYRSSDWQGVVDREQHGEDAGRCQHGAGPYDVDAEQRWAALGAGEGRREEEAAVHCFPPPQISKLIILAMMPAPMLIQIRPPMPAMISRCSTKKPAR